MARIFTKALATFALLASLAAPARSQQASGPWPLADVRVEGLARYSTPDVIRLSGLKPGAPVTLDHLQQVANQLMQTGLFRQLGFGYATSSQGLTLTLKVEEPAWNVPVVFDNIIWMTDAEFMADMAKHVPAFDGTAVEAGVANDFIAAAAERVLEARGIGGRVEVTPRMNARTGETTAFALAVRDTGANLRVCAISVPGAKAFRERDLLALGDGFVGTEYSRASLAAFSNGTLLQAYRERGYWAARFGAPSAVPTTGACDGLSVSIPVAEGVSYGFAGARWTGATALAAADLDRALDMRVGATADIRQLEDGLRAVDRLYQQQGYLTATHVARPAFDDGEGRVTFEVEVREGPQFRMGTMSTSGLTERQARDVTGRWRIKPGEVFDGVYYREFVGRETQRLGGALRAEAKLDEAAATAHISLSGL